MFIRFDEVLRKAVHLAGIFFLPILFWNRTLFSLLLLLFLLIYLIIERAEKKGKRIPFLSTLTRRCKRPEESGRLARGPIFLVLAGFITPYLFGVQAAGVGLAQALVADVASSLVGLKFGRKKIPWSPKKSWAGFLAFFLTAFLIDLVFVPLRPAIILALVGASIESLPIPEGDNLTVPVGVGLVATMI